MKKAVLMARVSSDEQAKGYSLDIQADNLTKYCERNSIAVLKTFKEDHSAKNFNRPAWKEFLEFLKKNKGEIDHLLVTSWDRFSRNLTDALIELRKLDNLGVSVLAIEQPIDMSIPENKAMLALYLALPEIDNDRRSIKVTEGMYAAKKSGRWSGSAPLGYRNTRDENNKPHIVPGDKAHIVQFAFERVIKGDSQAIVLEKLKSKGHSITRSNLSLLLRKPIYMGKIQLRAFKDAPAMLVDGLHDKLITERDFLRVQEILSENLRLKRKPTMYSQNGNLALRGMILCSCCGEKLTGSGSRSRNGDRHFYYHCHHCKNERLRANDANQIIESMFENFKLSSSAKVLFTEVTKSKLKASDADSKKLRAKYIKQEADQRQRLIKLQDLLVDGNVSRADYGKMQERYTNLLSEAANFLNEKQEEDEGKNDVLRSILNQMKRLDLLYKRAGVQEKHQILGSIFPKKFSIVQNKCRTTHFNLALARILSADKGLGNKKAGELSKYMDVSSIVGYTGFEPVTSTLSR